MNEKTPKKPELKVLAGDDNPKRLDSTAPSRLPLGRKPKEVDVLRPSASSHVNTKSFEPDVTSILEQEEEKIDAEASWGTAVKKAPPIGWFVLAGIVMCGLLFWASISLFKAKPKLEVVNEEKHEILIDKMKETADVKKTLGAMEQCVKGYLTAQTVTEKSRYVRHAERVKPLMENYYQTHPIKPVEFLHFTRMRSLGIENRSFAFGQVELLDGKAYPILVEQLADDEFKVDWESDICYQPIAWSDFIKNNSASPYDMRVYIQTDNFFAYQFRDDSAFDCYKITARDSDEYVFGYVKKGSDVAADVRRFITDVRALKKRRDNSPEPLILKLRFPASGNSRKCVWIDQLVEKRWTYVDPPEATETE